MGAMKLSRQAMVTRRGSISAPAFVRMAEINEPMRKE
jgi:hypothetical protein